MKRTCLLAVAVAVSTAVAAAQGPGPPPRAPEPEPSTIRSGEVAVRVEGCVRGARLKLSAGGEGNLDASLLNASEFVLHGPSELLQRIRAEHDGHYDEIAGVAQPSPTPGRRTTTIKERPLGRGRVRGGVTEHAGPAVNGRVVEDAPHPVRLKVTSLRHINDRCVERR